jgi:adenosylcobyric acid synthase
VPGLWLTWARTPAELNGVDWIVLPGSKQVSGDLAWLRAQGLDTAIARHANAGGAVLGICGGLQMLGRSISDPEGFDGERHAHLPGLGLLPIETHYRADKRVVPTTATFGQTQGPWAKLASVVANGYEIRQGVTQSSGHADAHSAVLHDSDGHPIGWQAGSVLGVYAHGLFESAAVMHALFGANVPSLDSSFDTLAEMVDEHFDAALLRRLLTKEKS